MAIFPTIAKMEDYASVAQHELDEFVKGLPPLGQKSKRPPSPYLPPQFGPPPMPEGMGQDDSPVYGPPQFGPPSPMPESMEMPSEMPEAPPPEMIPPTPPPGFLAAPGLSEQGLTRPSAPPAKPVTRDLKVDVVAFGEWASSLPSLWAPVPEAEPERSRRDEQTLNAPPIGPEATPPVANAFTALGGDPSVPEPVSRSRGGTPESDRLFGPPIPSSDVSTGSPLGDIGMGALATLGRPAQVARSVLTESVAGAPSLPAAGVRAGLALGEGMRRSAAGYPERSTMENLGTALDESQRPYEALKHEVVRRDPTGGYAAGVANLGLDVVTDPLTYLGTGAARSVLPAAVHAVGGKGAAIGTGAGLVAGGVYGSQAAQTPEQIAQAVEVGGAAGMLGGAVTGGLVQGARALRRRFTPTSKQSTTLDTASALLAEAGVDHPHTVLADDEGRAVLMWTDEAGEMHHTGVVTQDGMQGQPLAEHPRSDFQPVGQMHADAVSESAADAPESLGQLRNAISGTPFGVAPETVGGLAGAAAGEATAPEDATPEQRVQRILAGALAGAGLGHAGRRLSTALTRPRPEPPGTGTVGVVSPELKPHDLPVTPDSVETPVIEKAARQATDQLMADRDARIAFLQDVMARYARMRQGWQDILDLSPTVGDVAEMQQAISRIDIRLEELRRLIAGEPTSAALGPLVRERLQRLRSAAQVDAPYEHVEPAEPPGLYGGIEGRGRDVADPMQYGRQARPLADVRGVPALNAASLPPPSSQAQVAEQGVSALAGAVGAQAGTDEDTPLGERITRGVLGAEAGLRTRALVGGQMIPPRRLGVLPPLSPDPNVRRLQEMIRPQSKAPMPDMPTRLTRMRLMLARKITDRGADIVYIQKTVEKSGAVLTPDMMADELMRLTSEPGTNVVVRERWKNVLMADEETSENVQLYLIAQGNVDVANAKGNDARWFSGGMNKASSEAAILRLQADLAPAEFARVQTLAQEVSDLNNWALGLKEKSGIVTAKDAADWRKAYPLYTPVKILDYMQGVSEGTHGMPGRTLSVSDTGIRALTEAGGVRDREVPILSTLRNAYESMALARRNDAARALVKLRDQSPWLQQLMREVSDDYPKGLRGEESLYVFENGVRRRFIVPSDMAAVVKQEGAAPIPGVDLAMQLFKMSVTSRNPLFLVGNAMIDIPEAIIRESARSGGPWQTPGVALDLVRAFVETFQGITTGEFKGKAAEYLKEGGGFGYFDPGTQSVDQRLVEFRRQAQGRMIEVSSVSGIKRLMKDILTMQPVQTIGQRVELFPRVMAYTRAERRGVSTPAAVRAGQTITIDFSQGGSVVKQLDRLVPFLNVGVQGAMVPIRTIQEHPRGALATMGLGLVGSVLLEEVWNRSDPQRAHDYADVPSYIKDGGLVFMLPGEASLDERGERKPQFIWVRLRAFAPIIAVTREVTNRVLGDDPRNWSDLAVGAFSQVSPIRGAEQAVVPGLSTIVQLRDDRDWFRNEPIKTERSDEAASVLARRGAGTVNALSAEMGMYPDVHPSQTEFLARNLGGGYAQAYLGAGDLALGRTKESGTPQDIPVLGGFVGRAVRGSTGQRLQTLIDQRVHPDIQKMLYDVGVKPDITPTRREIRGGLLTLNEHEEYQRRANLYINRDLSRVLGTSEFRRGDTVQRQDAINKTVEKARKQATDEMIKRIGDDELGRRKRNAERRKALLASQ